MKFRHNIAYMNDLFVISDITVIIVNLRCMIKILDKKMLKGIHLY